MTAIQEKLLVFFIKKIEKGNSLKSAFEELEKIYAQVEDILKDEKVCCQCCGKCCDFSSNGMKLYIYHIERLYFLEKSGFPLTLSQGKCIGQKERLCSVHEYRPLGCRTQFCTHTFQEVYETFARKIQEIEKKYAVEYDYAEAFE